MFFYFTGCEIFSLFDSLNQRLKPGNCIVPTKELSKDDLAGTWHAGSLERNDTLIIRKDGKYKQKVHIEYLKVDYESDWQQWWIEYSEGGIPYLHLDGMRLCAAEPEIVSCDQPGGQDPWFDICKNESMLMNNEGILIVLGEPKQFIQSQNGMQKPDGLVLALPVGFEDSWVYTQQGP